MGNTPVQKQVRYPSGNVYDGMMVGSRRHGPGTLTWADGATYTGDWHEDEMSGNGVIRFPNGSEYSGAFSHNNPYGVGTLRTINGERLTGSWQFQGRSAGPTGPVGKYFFSGDVYAAEDAEKKHQHYSGPLSLHLTTGLVALPGMPDPRAYVWASVVSASEAEAQGGSAEDKKLAAEARAPAAGAVPQAAVIDSAPSSVAYGYQDPALLPKHADDHASYNVLDPRFVLGSFGLGPGAPASYNVKERNDRLAQQRGQAPVAVPVVAAPASAVPVATATAVPERSGAKHNVAF